MRKICKLSISVILAGTVVIAQESATVQAPEIVKAGEKVSLDISVDTAPNFDGGGVLVWVSGPGMFNTQSSCPLPNGQRVCHYSFTIPADATSGTYEVSRLAFSSGARMFDLPFKKVAFQVVANTGLTFPTRAEATLRASQVQLLRGEERRLQERLQSLKAIVGGEQEPLRTSTVKVLRGRLEDELNAIAATQSKFRNLGDESQKAAAEIFFDDLRIGYVEVLSGLTHGDKRAHTGSLQVFPARFIQSDKSKHGDSSQYPLVAQAIFRPFEINELAYTLVADTEALTFNLEVNSNPAGATIFYGRRGDIAYKQHSNPTDSTIKALPYAIWTIRFQKQGFRDKNYEFNPFVEPNRVITVNLEK